MFHVELLPLHGIKINWYEELGGPMSHDHRTVVSFEYVSAFMA